VVGLFDHSPAQSSATTPGNLLQQTIEKMGTDYEPLKRSKASTVAPYHIMLF
jgi:hypothetical protein